VRWRRPSQVQVRDETPNPGASAKYQRHAKCEPSRRKVDRGSPPPNRDGEPQPGAACWFSVLAADASSVIKTVSAELRRLPAKPRSRGTPRSMPNPAWPAGQHRAHAKQGLAGMPTNTADLRARTQSTKPSPPEAEQPRPELPARRRTRSTCRGHDDHRAAPAAPPGSSCRPSVPPRNCEPCRGQDARAPASRKTTTPEAAAVRQRAARLPDRARWPREVRPAQSVGQPPAASTAQTCRATNP